MTTTFEYTTNTGYPRLWHAAPTQHGANGIQPNGAQDRLHPRHVRPQSQPIQY